MGGQSLLDLWAAVESFNPLSFTIYKILLFAFLTILTNLKLLIMLYQVIHKTHQIMGCIIFSPFLPTLRNKLNPRDVKGRPATAFES